MIFAGVPGGGFFDHENGCGLYAPSPQRRLAPPPKRFGAGGWRAGDLKPAQKIRANTIKQSRAAFNRIRESIRHERKDERGFACPARAGGG
jgi:hypothetical protein